jgi:hypothetical protein
MGLLGGAAAFQRAPFSGAPLLVAALAFSLSNLLYAGLEHHLPRRSRFHFELSVTLSLMADILILAALMHVTGGLHSPFLALLLAPAVVSTLLLRTSLAPILVLFCLLVPLLLWAGVQVGLLTDSGPPQGLPFAQFYPWLTLALTIGLGCYLCLQVVGRLRDQQQSLGQAERLLEQHQEELLRRKDSERQLREQVGTLSERSLIADMSTTLARRIREPLGIVRARAEALCLASESVSSKESWKHDAEVLLHNLDSVSRGLRGILAFLPPSSVRGAVDLKAVFFDELQRQQLSLQGFSFSGEKRLARLFGSHDEIELAVGLVLRIATARNLGAGVSVGVCRPRHSPRVDFDIQFSVQPQPAQKTEELLRYAVLRQVVLKHGGNLHGDLPEEGDAHLRIEWPLAAKNRFSPQSVAASESALASQTGS